MKIAFAFSGTNSEEVLKNVRYSGFEKFYLKNEVLYIESFLDYLRMKEPSFVLGIGLYSRPSQYIRIETVCRNKFRNKAILPNGPDEIEILPHFWMDDDMDLTQGMGNSWCNYISYKIRVELKIDRYAFLHIPKNYSNKVAARCVDFQMPTTESLIGPDIAR